MPNAANSSARMPKELRSRLVRYTDLIPCTTAFIDTRTPGSDEKENFTIIGPGVSESPDQHVHIDLPHGFNIGAARQPPDCVNSQHSHESAEVFVIHSGRWAFYLGENAADGTIILDPGDTISIPVHVFRGFKNVGEDTGFMFAVLGGDDPGHVTWAPYVFRNAEQHGLVLLEDGSLVDTKNGQAVPADKRPMPVTTAAEVDAMRRMSAAEIAECVVRREALPDSSERDGYECPIIGAASPAEGLEPGKMDWPHGFHLRYIRVAPGAECQWQQRHEEEVILMHKGKLTVGVAGDELLLDEGDVLTVPIDQPRRYVNRGSEIVEAYIVRGGNHPYAPTFTDPSVQKVEP